MLTIKAEQDYREVLAAFMAEEDSSLPVGISPIPSVRDSSEKQDREEPLPSADLSIAALKANLFYAEVLKQRAFEEHKAAIIKAHEASTALNNALLRVR